jgi:hypothetical protein
VRRVPAAEIEALVGRAVREQLGDTASGSECASKCKRISWRSSSRHRNEEGSPTPTSREQNALFSSFPGGRHLRNDVEIIVPSTAPQDTRPIRAETRAKLVASIARGRRWLNEIVTGAVTSIKSSRLRQATNAVFDKLIWRSHWLSSRQISCSRPFKDDCLGELASRACAMLRLSGPASMRCLVCRLDPRMLPRKQLSRRQEWVWIAQRLKSKFYAFALSVVFRDRAPLSGTAKCP